MEKSKSFEDVIVWQKAHQFVLDVYRMTEKFPKSEVYGLTSQFRRAAVSIPANIAEGFKKKSKADKVRYYNIAQGSIEECRYYIRLAHDLCYLEQDELKGSLINVSKLLDSYINGVLNSL
jgi:four helix bundle protein